MAKVFGELPGEKRRNYMQAIITKYLGPTNYKGSRIKASCERGSIVVSYDDSLNQEQAHIAAVKALIRKFNKEDIARHGAGAVKDGRSWNSQFVSGGMPDGGYCHVFMQSYIAPNCVPVA